MRLMSDEMRGHSKSHECQWGAGRLRPSYDIWDETPIWSTDQKNSVLDIKQRRACTLKTFDKRLQPFIIGAKGATREITSLEIKWFQSIVRQKCFPQKYRTFGTKKVVSQTKHDKEIQKSSSRSCICYFKWTKLRLVNWIYTAKARICSSRVLVPPQSRVPGLCSQRCFTCIRCRERIPSVSNFALNVISIS